MTNLQFYWHIHHKVLVEPLTEPIENRIAFIKENKPKHEVELRLRLMKPVKGKLPEAVVEAAEAYDRAEEAYDKAGKVYNKAWKALDETVSGEAREAYKKGREARDKAWKAYLKVVSDHAEEIEALHAKECPDCPWSGQTIFPD